MRIELVDIFGMTLEPIVVFFLLGELGVLVALAIAYSLARYHKGTAHHYLMLAAFLADLLVFKPLMYSRAGTAWGAFPWDGTRIAPHLFVAALAGAIGVIDILLGFKYRVKKGPKMFMPPKGRLHRTLGLLFLAAWSVAFVIGLVIFLETWVP